MTQSGLSAFLADTLNTRRAAFRGGVRLHVISGYHTGALATLESDVVSVGASLANDIVLAGDGLSPHHFTITVINAWLGLVRVEPAEGAIRVNGRTLEKGDRLHGRAPLRIEAGHAILELSPSLALDQLRKPALGAAAALAALLLLGPAISGLGALMPGHDPGFVPSPGVASADAGQHLAGLQARLQEADLVGAVTPELGPAGGILATGAVDDAGLEKWRAILKWHDSQPGAPLLVNNVVKSAEVVGSGIRSVWLDGTPELVLNGGQSVRVGGMIAGGWRVDAIDDSGVLLSRDKQTRRIAF